MLLMVQRKIKRAQHLCGVEESQHKLGIRKWGQNLIFQKEGNQLTSLPNRTAFIYSFITHN